MESARDIKRQALRDSLINSAEALIKENGLPGLKARDVTKRAGCALGTIYNVVQDLDELIMLVNTRTLARLGEALSAAVPKDASPRDTMQALARAYVEFAQTETPLWSTIFAHQLPEGIEVPQWYAEKYIVLIQEIVLPLSKMRPDLDPEALRLRAQTLFASVHGVVQLSIYGKFVGAPAEMLASEVEALVDAMARGTDLISKDAAAR